MRRTNQRIFRQLMLLATIISGLCLVACGTGQASAPIRIGSKLFTEQYILGEMYAILLEDAGLKVERKFKLGDSLVVHQALLNAEIDLYPEYTGTGLTVILGQTTNNEPRQVYDTVAKAYQEQFHIIWLDAAPMNNTFALAMTRELAAKYGITTLSDLVAHASDLTLIGPIGFETRPDGIPGMQRIYGDFQLKRYITVDPTLRYKGLFDGQGDVVVGFGTDGEITEYNLMLLEDDKHVFPPYQVAPLVRQSVLEANPQIRDVLNRLAPKLTNAVMQRLNYEVTARNRTPAEVAREFLIQEQL